MDDKFVGERLAAILMEKGISERKMSLALGRSPSYINKIINGKINLSVAELSYICDYLKITMVEFFSDQSSLSQEEMVICDILRTLPKDDVMLIKDIVEAVRKRSQK